MPEQKNTIIITLCYQNESFEIATYANEYYSLMTLISDKLGVPGLGLCCGMGSCGTCMVQIYDKYNPAKRNVLACDIQINDDIANKCVIVPDKVY